jgi:hypothetical protein
VAAGAALARGLKENFLLKCFSKVGAECTWQFNTCNCCRWYRSAAYNKFLKAAITTILTCSVGGGSGRGDSYECNVF